MGIQEFAACLNLRYERTVNLFVLHQATAWSSAEKDLGSNGQLLSAGKSSKTLIQGSLLRKG